MAENDEERCGLCGCTQGEHAELNHEFNKEGHLIPKSPKPKTPPRPPSIDLVLRLLLVQKGILTSDELNSMEATIRDQLSSGGNAPDRPDPGNSG